jgi:hypothetical protein
MKRYSYTDINKASGEIFDEALKAPIALTKRGKVKLIVLAVEQFDELSARPRRLPDTRQVGTLETMPEDMFEDVKRGVQAYLKDDGE